MFPERLPDPSHVYRPQPVPALVPPCSLRSYNIHLRFALETGVVTPYQRKRSVQTAMGYMPSCQRQMGHFGTHNFMDLTAAH